MDNNVVAKHILDVAVGLEKKSKAELITELSDIFDNASKIDLNSKENINSLKNLAKAFEAIFSKAGDKSINFADLIEMPPPAMFAEMGKIAATSFWDAWNSVSGGISDSLTANLEESLKQLKLEQADLKRERTRIQSEINKKVANKEKADSLIDFDDKTVKSLKVEGDVIQKAKEMYSNLRNTAKQLSDIGKEQGQDSQEYIKALYEAQEIYHDMYRMRKTLQKTEAKVPESIRAAYGLLEYDDNDGFHITEDRMAYEEKAYKAGKNPLIPFYETNAGEFIGDRWERFAGTINKSQKELDAVESRLSEIDARISEITQSIQATSGSAEVVVKNENDGLKTLNEIEEAYKRIRVESEKRVDDRQVKHIMSALEFDPDKSSEGIKSLYDQYQKAAESGDWVEEYRALLKYVRLYESYLTTTNKTHSNKITKKNNPFTPLYEQLKPMADNAQNMLQNILNMGDGKPLVGMGGTGSGGDGGGPTPEDVANAQRVKEETEAKLRVEKEAREEIEKRLLAEKEIEESLKKQRAEEEKLAKAAEKKRIAEEAAAEAKRKAAEEPGVMQAMDSFQGEFGKTDKKNETLAFIDTKTGNMSELFVGDPHSVTMDPGTSRKMSELGYDMEVHSHSWETAAPSIDDFEEWFRQLGYIKKFGIRAGEELLAFDFSKLDPSQLLEIIDKYQTLDKRLSAQVQSMSFDEQKEQFGSYQGRQEAVQVMLRQGLEEIMQGIPGVMKSIQMPALPAPDAPTAATTPKKKAQISLADEYAKANDEVKELIKNLAILYKNMDPNIDPGDGFDPIADAEEKLEKIAPELLKADMDQWESFGEKFIDKQNAAQQEVAVTQQAVDGLNESLEKTEQLLYGNGTGSDVEDASSTELENLRQQLEAKDAEITDANRKREEAELAERVAQDEATAERHAREEAEDRAYMYDRAMTSMEEDMADLRGQLADAKTGGGEEHASVASEELKTLLNSIVYNVKIVHDDNDKTANKIEINESTLETTLTKVFANILNPQTQQNDSEQKQAPWALDNTLKTVKGVLDNIQNNTGKIGTIVPSNVDTIAGTALDGRLTEIKSVLESIEKKIVDGGKIFNRDGAKQAYQESQKDSGSTKAARSNMMKSIINDYKTLGKLSAQFASEENLETKAMLENLKEEIARKRKSLKLTMDENASLREKYSIAFDAEKRLLDAAKAQEEIDKQTKQKDKDTKADWKKKVKEAQRATGINAATTAANAGDQTVVRAIGTEGISKDIENKAKELSDQIEALRVLRDEIDKKGNKVSDEDRENLSKQISKVKELKTEVDGYLKIHEKYSGDNAKDLGDGSDFGAVGTDEYWNNITAAIKSAASGKTTIKGLNADTGELTGTTRIAANTFAEWSATVDPLTGRLKILRTGIKKTETLVETITRKTKEIFTYFSGSSIIFKAFNELKKGIQYVREIDKALTELRKVTNETEETYDRFLKTAAKTGARLGTTISAVTEATATFAKLGYNMKQATEMAEAAIVYKNVGDNIASTGDAADSIISTLKGFGMEASEAMAIVDRFNEVGNRFAITSQGIGEALRLSASALNEGGNSLNESIAMITAANEVVNDPSSVGTALKTLTLRLRGAKTELEDAGLDIENMATTTSQLQAKLLALTGGKVDIMLDANTFKNSTQILREMAAAWEHMTDVQRASALELMGGKRQANVLSALVTNFDTVEEAIEASAGSAGSALRENEVFLDSFEGRLQQLTAATQAKWSEALDTDVIKDAIQLLTKLIETLDFEDSALIDVVGLLTKGLSWLMDLLGNGNGLYTLIAFFGAKTIQTHGWFDFFDGLKKTGEETIESLTEDIKGLDAEIKSLTEKANKQSGRSQKNTLQQIDVKKQLKTNKQEQLDAMKLSEQEQQTVVDSFDISDDIKKAQEKVATAQKNLTEAQWRKKGLLSANGYDDMEDYKRSLVEEEKMLLKSKKTVEGKLAKENRPEYQTALDNINQNLDKNTYKMEWANRRSDAVEQYTKELQDAQVELEEYNKQIQQTDASLDRTNTSTKQASVATNGNTVVQNSNTGAQNMNAVARQGAGAQTDAHTQDINENTVATEENTGAQNKNTKTLGKGIGKLKEFGKQMLQTVAYMALLQGAMQLLDGLAWGLNEAWNVIFPKKKTFEELHDEFEKASSDLSEERSELKNLEGKLEDVESKIEDIQSLGTLSFTSQKELENLQKQSAELERQIEMQKILTKNKQRGANTAALNAANAYLQQSAETDNTLEEAAEKTKETGEQIGSIVDGALMVGGAILMIATGWTGAGAVAGGAMMAAGMAGTGKGVGGAVGEAVGKSEYQKQQTNRQAIDSYSTKRADYQKKLDEAYAKGDATAYAKILEEYENFETMMADNIGGLLEYISTVDYNTLAEDQKKQYEAYNQMVNKYNLDNGGSITNAVDSILSYDRYEKTGYEFDQIQEKFKDGDISSEQAAQQMKSLIDASPSLQAEFDALGIKIEDVIASYIQLGKAAQENVSLMSSLDKISAVTGAFDDLGNAVKEFKEEGYASAGTLENLNEKFGKIDGFEELYKVLATGEGDLETAVTNVANAYVGQTQAFSDMTDDELAIMVSRLKALGVLNAEEVLMARQKGQAQLDALSLAYSIDLSNYGTAEQAKLAIAQAAGLDVASIADDQVENLAKKYGVDLKNYASTEEAKIAIAQERARAEAQTNRSDLTNKYKSGEIDYAEYMAGLTSIDNSLNFDAMSGIIQGIIDKAYQGFEFNFDGRIGIGSDFDEKVIDKATKDANEAFRKEMDYWENRIGANQARYEQLQNEIDLMEAKGQKADASFYEEQIKLENERLFLLGEQKKAAQAHLATLTEGSEEWF